MTYQNSSPSHQLKSSNQRAKKSLGQNFLRNKDIIKKIVKSGEVTSKDNIIEIGPGLGILTEELCKNAKDVTAIELDASLLPMLKLNTLQFKNLTILNEDALQFNIQKLCTDNSRVVPYKLIANIPYYITSPLINHYLKEEYINAVKSNRSPLIPEIIVLLIQKEVAEKICMKGEFEKTHSVLNLNIEVFGKAEIVSIVGKNNFYPVPKIDSAIIKISVYDKPNLQEKIIKNIDKFFKMIEIGFSNPRKQIHNNLSNGFQIKSEEMQKILDAANIDPRRRAETIEIEEWERIFSIIV